MAGITNGNFCKKMASYGFDMVTLGGYNIDGLTIDAGCKIIARGRSEFDIPEDELISHLKKESKLVKNSWDGMLSVNLRTTSFDPVIGISKLQDVDVVEINAHCRQPEIMRVGAGQALLYSPEKLHNLTKKVAKHSKSKVSVKIRANVPDVNLIEVAKLIEDAGSDYLHLDAMKPGFDSADYEIVKSIKENSDIFLIGNNSIKDLKSAKKMMDAGADGISIARAVIGGIIPFDISLI